MFKKIILASAILAATVSVAEAAAPAPYVGASIGLTNNFITSGNDAGGTYRGVPFNLFAGYGGVLSQSFYLAGELNATVANATVTNSDGNKSTYGFGVSLIPGVMLNESTLAFARVGVVNTHFSNLVNSNRTGGQIGLGLQTSVTQNIDVRGEYDYVAYQSKSTFWGSMAPRQDVFTVGLVYKIN